MTADEASQELMLKGVYAYDSGTISGDLCEKIIREMLEQYAADQAKPLVEALERIKTHSRGIEGSWTWEAKKSEQALAAFKERNKCAS